MTAHRLAGLFASALAEVLLLAPRVAEILHCKISDGSPQSSSCSTMPGGRNRGRCGGDQPLTSVRPVKSRVDALFSCGRRLLVGAAA